MLGRGLCLPHHQGFINPKHVLMAPFAPSSLWSHKPKASISSLLLTSERGQLWPEDACASVLMELGIFIPPFLQACLFVLLLGKGSSNTIFQKLEERITLSLQLCLWPSPLIYLTINEFSQGK